MNNWKIRRALENDAADLTDCFEAAYDRYKSQIPNLPDVTTGLVDDIRNRTVWVAVAQGRTVGGLVLIIDSDRAMLANVAVADSARGIGLGRALIDVAARECQTRGVKTLSLTTHAAMAENIALYEHLGWDVSDRSGNKVHMEKRISS